MRKGHLVDLSTCRPDPVLPRNRFSLQILNYTVTSNHVHLLVKDNDEAKSIPPAIQLVAGRVGQEYNQRKRRKGAFWEDRYHATAIESGEHLRRCLVYIDLNMVRAGVANHPAEWPYGVSVNPAHLVTLCLSD
jgi:putative transposase